MSGSRTVHGLAGLIDSDDSGSESDGGENSKHGPNGKSVFDVPGIFNKDVTRKLREGERIQLEMAATVEAVKETVEVIDMTKSNDGTIGGISRSRKRRRTRSSNRTLLKRPKESYIHLLTSDSDSDCSNKVDDGGKQLANDLPQTNEASFVDLDISQRTELDDEDEEEIYRVVVSQIGNEDARVIVRLTENETMVKVLTEAAILAGKGGILMMGTDENRREVLPEDTVKSLGLSTVGLTRMEFVPINERPDGKSVLPPGFTIKFITGNRRETKEIRCKPDEPLGAIFGRYCSMAGVQRKDVVFKFDDDPIGDDGTPAELGIESGDIVEAHYQKENVIPSGVDCEPKSRRRRSRRAPDYYGR